MKKNYLTGLDGSRRGTLFEVGLRLPIRAETQAFLQDDTVFAFLPHACLLAYRQVERDKKQINPV